LGVDVVLESVELIAAGKAPRLAQDESRATYDPLCRDEHAQVDWSIPVAKVYNLIRGCDPQPGAYVLRDGVKVRLYDTRRLDRSDLAPGIIGEINESGLVVGADGGAIRIGRMRAAAGKVAAREAAEQLGLSVGGPF
jgi:methionyl-tRNA formyltransferase